MKYILILCLLALTCSRIVMNKNQWVSALETLASRKTRYKNVYPYNVLYYDGMYWYCDCVNLLKALFNGRNINNWKEGSKADTLSNTGDVGCSGFIEMCTDKSSDFSRLKEGEPRVLYLNGHIGTYIGKIVNDKYNVIECTAAWGGGIIYSWVDSNGTRRREKGGESKYKWTRHGKPTKWVSY